MINFEAFPIQADEKTEQIAKDIQAICLKVAEDNRGDVESAYVVQHSQSELHALYEIAARTHDRVHLDGYVLQCGLFCGGSALMMAHAMRDDASNPHPLLAIDSYTKDYRPLRELFDDAYFEMRENLWEFRLQEHITPVLSDTVSYLQHFWRLPLRIAFVDSSHHYEPTLKELNLILPHLVGGGWLILHDMFSEETPGVLRAVNEVFEPRDLSEFTFYRTDQLAIIRNCGVGTPVDTAADAAGDSDTPRWVPKK
ncbi:MAG: class I SAM-dependent methyltransferase [Candidatus Poribacteria bacterium]|nr:class I SAM-dependent methyltransferase [Candidatus Poribacteria bacterium]MDE0505611.1 class I SAM-dependent methyltransferase [Candidatus Poribacteria bacterium]